MASANGPSVTTGLPPANETRAPIDGDEEQAIERNHLLVARRGREPGLMLERDGRDVSLRSWVAELFDSMQGICELLDSVHPQRPYLAALQEHLAWQTLRFLKPAGAPSEAEFRDRHPAVRVDAVENYTRGLLATNADDKHRFFTQAARLDSHYSLPDFQLGRLLWNKKEYKSAAEWFQKVGPS